MIKFPHFLFGLLALFLLIQCKPDPVPPTIEELILTDSVKVNPFEISPLTARIWLTTLEPTRIESRVVGQQGTASDVVHDFAEIQTEHQLDILGLYANTNNQIELTFYDEQGEALGTQTFSAITAPLSAAMPDIRIDQSASQRAPGMTLVSYFGHDGSLRPQRPFIFDEFGDIRWWLDFKGHPELGNMFYDNGVERLANGNLYFGEAALERVYEMNMLGEIVNFWELPGYTFHHNVIEKPDGNFIVTVSKRNEPTVEDYLIELDRGTGDIVRTWNLNESLEYARRTLIEDPVDWIHVNAVAYDAQDNTIVISGRTQGVIKLTMDNQVVWIMGCHQGWGTNGRGEDLNQFLLQPLDANGNPITDPDVLNGLSNHPDFEWNWYQHAPILTPENDWLIFDNGDNRNFNNVSPYSRAVAYEVDDVNRTIQQTWTYGKERGEETYSRIVSEVDYLVEQDHVVYSSGSITFGGVNVGKIIEVDYATRDVISEVTLTPPIAPFKVTFHRTERLSLYP
ncbi:MAG: aryl-sulfate sulfotransferase [Bacteroidota bacterium]